MYSFLLFVKVVVEVLVVTTSEANGVVGCNQIHAGNVPDRPSIIRGLRVQMWHRKKGYREVFRI